MLVLDGYFRYLNWKMRLFKVHTFSSTYTQVERVTFLSVGDTRNSYIYSVTF